MEMEMEIIRVVNGFKIKIEYDPYIDQWIILSVLDGKLCTGFVNFNGFYHYKKSEFIKNDLLNVKMSCRRKCYNLELIIKTGKYISIILTKTSLNVDYIKGF